MLVLTRKLEESIQIGDDIQIKILSIGQGGQVKLGITAPRDVVILRQELLERAAYAQHPVLQSEDAA